MTLVIFHPKKNEIKLFKLDRPYWNESHWLGEPYVVWSSVETAIAYAWEVVGCL